MEKGGFVLLLVPVVVNFFGAIAAPMRRALKMSSVIRGQCR